MNKVQNHYENQRENPDALIGLLVQKDTQISEINAQLAEHTRHINILEKNLLVLQQARFAAKSEKRPLDNSSAQLPLFDGPPEVVAPVVSAPAPVTIAPHTRAARVKRDLSKLPHCRVVHEPKSTKCNCCGEELSKIGEDVSEELEYQPAKLFVNEHVRPRYACNRCKEGGVQQASLPGGVKPLQRSIAGAGLISQILVSKYVDHLPLHRQEQIFARKGFEIPRRSLCTWVELAVDQYLAPLWGVLEKELFVETYLQGDETTLKIQDGNVPGRCHTGYLWGVYAPRTKLVWFRYAPSRAGAVAKEIFTPFQGTLQTDAYAGYNPVLLPDTVERIACLAHVRRKFIEAENTAPKEAATVLKLIAELYRLDKGWQKFGELERGRRREAESLPVLQKLESYLRDLSLRTLPKAKLMEAIGYTLRQWEEIRRIFSDGRYELDNNPIEREMRPIALGRKNYLFAGSHPAAKRAAIIYSLFGTARLHKVNPVEWLRFVFSHFKDCPAERYAELLPHGFAARVRDEAGNGAT